MAPVALSISALRPPINPWRIYPFAYIYGGNKLIFFAIKKKAAGENL